MRIMSARRGDSYRVSFQATLMPPHQTVEFPTSVEIQIGFRPWKKIPIFHGFVDAKILVVGSAIATAEVTFQQPRRESRSMAHLQKKKKNRKKGPRRRRRVVRFPTGNGGNRRHQMQNCQSFRLFRLPEKNGGCDAPVYNINQRRQS